MTASSNADDWGEWEYRPPACSHPREKLSLWHESTHVYDLHARQVYETETRLLRCEVCWTFLRPE